MVQEEYMDEYIIFKGWRKCDAYHIDSVDCWISPEGYHHPLRQAYSYAKLMADKKLVVSVQRLFKKVRGEYILRSELRKL